MPDGIDFNAPADSNNAVMVNNDNQLRNPSVMDFLNANPEIGKASDIANYNNIINSLDKKTQNIVSADVGNTYFVGTLTADKIVDKSGGGGGGGGGGDIEGDVTVDSLLSKSIVQANYYSEDNENKFAKGWRLAWVNNYDSGAGTADLYIVDNEELRFTKEQIWGNELPLSFEKGYLDNISANDVFYFFNAKHYPKGFYVTSVNNLEGYISVQEIQRGSLEEPTGDNTEAVGFRYGMFIVGTINTDTQVITYNSTKLDYGKINLLESAIINGWNAGAAISTLSSGRDNITYGSYSSAIGRNNSVLSYSSGAFGQANTVFGEKSFIFGTHNEIDADIGNFICGTYNKIVPDVDWAQRTDFTRYDSCFISGNQNIITLNDSITASQGTYLGLFGVGLRGIQTTYPQFITGRYNDPEEGNDMLEIVGNGTADNSRSNARTLDKDGNATFAGSGTFGGDVTDGYGNVLRTVATASIQLMQTKLNAGALHVSNGVASNSTFVIPTVFSVAAIVSPDYVGDIITLGALTISAASGTITASDGVDTLSVAASTTLQNVVIFTHSSTNSVLTVNGSSDESEMSQISGIGYTVGSTTSTSGAISNLKIFNFDITAEGAPYTLGDYTAGNPVPPKLHNGTLDAYSTLTIGTDLTVGSAVNGSFVNSTTALPDGAANKVVFGSSNNLVSFTIRDASCAYVPTSAINLNPFVGSPVEIEVSCWLRRNYAPSTAGAVSLQGFVMRFSDTYLVSKNRDGLMTELPETGVWYRKNWTYKGALNLNSFFGTSLYFTGHIFTMEGGVNTPHLDAFEMADLQVKVHGASLSLANYTVKSGTTQTIFDVSGNAQDATVSSGSIAGDNDVSVARLVDFISAL